jgi:hypothetical protein
VVENQTLRIYCVFLLKILGLGFRSQPTAIFRSRQRLNFWVFQHLPLLWDYTGTLFYLASVAGHFLLACISWRLSFLYDSLAVIM